MKKITDAEWQKQIAEINAKLDTLLSNFFLENPLPPCSGCKNCDGIGVVFDLEHPSKCPVCNDPQHCLGP